LQQPNFSARLFFHFRNHHLTLSMRFRRVSRLKIEKISDSLADSISPMNRKLGNTLSKSHLHRNWPVSPAFNRIKWSFQPVILTLVTPDEIHRTSKPRPILKLASTRVPPAHLPNHIPRSSSRSTSSRQNHRPV
jgi:hypothetical protein